MGAPSPSSYLPPNLPTKQSESFTIKCHVHHLGGDNARHVYRMGGSVLEAVEYKKDVGVIVHQSMKPSMQCARAAARANGILGQLSRAVSYRDKCTFLKQYKVYVRPHLEYAVASWSPWLVGDREKVWRRAVGMVSNLRGRSYEDRMAEVGMTSLLDKRVRGNMIATYRIMTGKDMVDPRTFFDMAEEWAGPRTRLVAGVHNIRETRSRLDIRDTPSAREWPAPETLPNSLKGVGTVLGFKIGYDEWVSAVRGGWEPDDWDDDRDLYSTQSLV